MQNGSSTLSHTRSTIKKDGYDTDEQFQSSGLQPNQLSSISSLLQGQRYQSNQKEYQQENSSFSYKEYLKTLKIAQNQGILLYVENELQKNQIKTYNKKEQIHDFSNSCLKTDWESARYKVSAGRCHGILNVLRINLYHKNFYEGAIGSGQFGKIYQYRVHKQSFVVKNINFVGSQSSICAALREIFMAKIASALKIGPKFYNIFGFDVIIFNDGLQFAMETCETKFMQQESKQAENDLLYSLKLLHSLQFCHLDIKPDNIAWSPCYRKYVFLDFGFCKYVKEQPGFKSKTKFIGTFNYASPQMKKLYFLRDNCLVDLYHNDLHCLKQSLSYISDPQRCKQNDFFIEMNDDLNWVEDRIVESFDQEKQLFSQKKLLHKYTLLKYNLFIKDYANVKSLILQQKVLISTFRRLILIEQDKNQYGENWKKLFIQLYVHLEKLQSKTTKINKIDSFLTNYTFKVSTGLELFTSFSKLIEIAKQQNSSDLLKQIWLKQNWMVDIFYFLDVYSQSTQDIKQHRICLIYKIHSLISSDSYKSDTLKFRDVLLYFFDYFHERQNLTLLMRIQSYFVIIDDFYHQDRLQILILQMLQKITGSNNIILIVLKNMEYFFGKILLSYLIDFKENSDNYHNLEKLLDKNDLSTQTKQFIIDSIELMKFIKLLYSFYNRRISLAYYESKGKQYLAKYSKVLSSELITFVNFFFFVLGYALQKKQTSVFLVNSDIESQYLKNCIKKYQLWESQKSFSLSKLNKLIDEQPLLKQFAGLWHIFAQNLLSQNVYKQICLDRIHIFERNCINLCQEDITVLLQNLGNQLTSPFILKYVKSINLSIIKNVTDVSLLCSNFYRIFLVFFSQPIDTVWNELSQIVNEIAQFIEFASKIMKLLQQEAKSTHEKLVSEDQFYFKSPKLWDKEFIESPDILKDILLIQYHVPLIQAFLYYYKQKNMKKSILSFINLLKDTTVVTPLLFLSSFYYNSGCQIRQRGYIERIFYEYCALAYKQNRMDIILLGKQMLPIGIIIYAKQNAKEAYQFLIKITEYLQNYKINPSLTFYPNAVHEYKKLAQIQTLTSIVSDATSLNLKYFQKCPVLTITIFQFYLKVKNLVPNIISTDKRLRIMIICVFYAQYFHEGFFRPYKTKIFNQILSLRNMKYQSINYIRKYKSNCGVLLYQLQYKQMSKKKQINSEKYDRILFKFKAKCQNYGKLF